MRRLLCKILSGSSFKTFRTVCRFHFGQISTARAVMYTKKHSKVSASIAAFTEETLVRGELSDNFCYYQENHDNVSTLNPLCTTPRSESIPTFNCCVFLPPLGCCAHSKAGQFVFFTIFRHVFFFSTVFHLFSYEK